MSSSYPSYSYRVARSRDNQFLNKITLVCPLLTADGTDALIDMPSHAPDDDFAERHTPIHVAGTKQVLGFNVVTHALMRCYANAASKLRRQEIAQASRVVPVGVPGTSRSSVLAPRTSKYLSRRRDPHLSPYM